MVISLRLEIVETEILKNGDLTTTVDAGRHRQTLVTITGPLIYFLQPFRSRLFHIVARVVTRC